MLFSWNEQTFGWYRDASDYTGYSQALADLLWPHLADCRTLCDMGCGMGLVDLVLADRLQRVTCVDVSQAALDDLRAQAARQGVENLDTVCADGPTLDGAWDGVMALFHGDVRTVGDAYWQKARKVLVLVVHGSAYGTTGPAQYRVRKCCDVDSTQAWLEERCLTYTLERGALEFGQPHRSFDDAVAYTRTFTKNVPEDELLAHVRATVTETGRSDFPLYTPKTRTFGIFTIRRDRQ